MCCVGGMVEDTTLEAIGHRFKPYGVHIYSDAFFFQVAIEYRPGCGSRY